MRRDALAGVLLGALALGGCAIPTWVPWLGQKAEREAAPPAPAPVRKAETDGAPDRARLMPLLDDSVSDRVVAVVNNDAITLGELLESIAAWRHENRQRTGPSDEELATQFLNRLIDARLQLQEADRERIVVDDAEVTEELTDRVKKLGVATLEAFEESLKGHGVTIDMLRKRVRDGMRMQRIIRRKVTLRVSVTDTEIDRYLESNRPKLETGLSYHARHILLLPDGTSDAAWEAARVKADALRAEAISGADFAELARRHSADASAKDGGDLGTLKRGELAQEIEAQILRLESGEVSRPYRSSLGWHVFKLEAKEGLEGDGLARVRQQIRDILFREKYEARLDTWLKEIKQRAIIEVRM
jgi:peptidyl-prolyl cis-trans isomerase SurA